jgi:hypothetical protein
MAPPRTSDERECDAILQRVRTEWPQPEEVADRDLRVLVRAARRVAAERDLVEALEFLLCRHPMAWAVRAPVMLLFHAVDDQVMAVRARPA